MAQTRWNIRNYNAFLRNAKSSYGLTHAESQSMYRSMRGRLEHSLRAIDLDRHPRIASKIAKEILESREEEEEEGIIEEPPEGEIDIEWWLDNYSDDWADESYDEYEAMYETTQGEK